MNDEQCVFVCVCVFIRIFEKNTNLSKWQDGFSMPGRSLKATMCDLWSLVQFDRCWLIFESQEILNLYT